MRARVTTRATGLAGEVRTNSLFPPWPVRAFLKAGGILAWFVIMTVPVVLGEQRFPPPDFESGHQLPATPVPPARSLFLEYLDVGVLVLALGLATYLVLKQRSRKAIVGLSLFSLGYFGFYRKGCVCAIGAVQNVAAALSDPAYALPLPALAFFVLPLVVALFAGRAFCAGVCPHGALQDLVLIKPVTVPRWLEQGLSLVPYIYLGAGVALAAAGGAFIICRYDPFVPLFRLSGSVALLLTGAAFLLLGMFVGRPYCRFLCPYGALLRVGAAVSKWRVTITPGACTQCRLCEDACPYGAIQEPTMNPSGSAALTVDRRRLTWMLLLLPVLVVAGGLVGSSLAPIAARVHLSVALSERYLREKANPVPLGVQSAAALALNRAEQNPRELLSRAVEIRQRFGRAGLIFGWWMGLVIGVKLIGLSLRQNRADYEPDRGACLCCGRCFAYCPEERVRLGLCPAGPAVAEERAPASLPTGT